MIIFKRKLKIKYKQQLHITTINKTQFPESEISFSLKDNQDYVNLNRLHTHLLSSSYIHIFLYFLCLYKNLRVLLRHGRFRIEFCHCRGLGRCRGTDSIPGSGTSACLHCSQKKKKKEKKNLWVHTYACLYIIFIRLKSHIYISLQLIFFFQQLDEYLSMSVSK